MCVLDGVFGVLFGIISNDRQLAPIGKRQRLLEQLLASAWDIAPAVMPFIPYQAMPDFRTLGEVRLTIIESRATSTVDRLTIEFVSVYHYHADIIFNFLNALFIAFLLESIDG